MTNIQHIPDDIRAEFSVNADGQAFASRRAIARLAGVDEKSIRNLLQNLGAEQTPHEIFESHTGKLFEGAELIPDTLVSLILEYYAYECQPRYRSEQAKQVCRVFRSIGFRVWVQRELNWVAPPPRTITPPTSFDALEYSKKALSLAGIEQPLVESWGLGTLAHKIDTPNREIYLDAQKIIVNKTDVPDNLSSVTEVCEKLKEHGIKYSSQALNKDLVKMGLQTVTRDSKGRIQYQLTDKSQDLGKIVINSTGTGRNVTQLKWYADKLIELIK